MGIFIRQGAKASVASYIGAFIGYLNIVFITPYCLPPEIIGLSRVLVDMGIYLAFIAQLGVQPGLINFFPKFRGKDNQLLFLILIIPLIGFVIFTILFFILKGVIISYFVKNSGLVNDYINLVLPIAFFIIYLGILEAYSSCLLRIVVPKLIRDVILRILNIMIIVMFYLKWIGLYQFVWGLVIIYAVATILNFFYLTRITKINLKVDFRSFDTSILKSFITYILLVLVMGIGSNIVNKIDVFMISSYINLTHTGIYSIAFYIIVIIEIPARSFQQMAGPFVASAFHEGNIKSIKDIYSKSSLIQFLTGGIIFLLVWINIDNIFSIMPNGKIYQSGKFVILFLGFSKLFDMITGVNALIIANSKNYAYLLIFVAYLTVVTIIANNLLIPAYGITGAAVAALIGLASYNILLIVFLWIKLKIQPFSLNTIWVIVVLLVLLAVNMIIPRLNNMWIDIVFRSSILSGLFLVAIYKIRISGEVNDLIDQSLKFLRLKKS
jgi:O-antigen/teichoic acid export membrane protein